MSTARLYEITDELVVIQNMLAETGGELTPEIEAVLDGITGAFDEKVERVIRYTQNEEAFATGARAEADRLLKIARAIENGANHLKDYLMHQMQRAGRTEVRTAIGKVAIQRNGRPSIRWTQPVEMLPAEFRREKVELDSDAALKAWKANGELPAGFHAEVGSHLRIR